MKEIKGDAEGLWFIKVQASRDELAAIMLLALHTEKTLEVEITPPQKEIVHGQIIE